MKKAFLLMLVLALVFSLCGSAFASAEAEVTLADIEKPVTADVPENLQVDWSGSTDTEQVAHYNYEFFTNLMEELAATYPEYCTMYSLGHTAQEREMWCLEITNYANDADKTGIAIYGEIHGDEMESGECGMYIPWWILVNSSSEYVQYMLDNYIIYCIPVINVDGKEESFTYNVRDNVSPNDADGDGIPFSDPYTDVDGDGFISDVFIGESGLDLTKAEGSWFGLSIDGVELESVGMESPDWNLDGELGNDPRDSGIDMNRTFDYQYATYDITTYNPNGVTYTGSQEMSVVGDNSWRTNGQGNDRSGELEVQAIDKFFETHEIAAMVTLHTGIQTVLWPWCYREATEDDTDLAEMAVIGKQMAEAASEAASADGVTRNFYYRSSWSDYPTAAELIDYCYGRFGIHAYTIEVYEPGSSDPDTEDDFEMYGNGVYVNSDGTLTKGATWQNGD